MTVVSRAGWGARPPKSAPSAISPVGVVLHWEGPKLGAFGHDKCAGKVRGIQNYHMNTNGWADVAYSMLVCPHGVVFEGRGRVKRTAANGTNDGNSRYHAVCYLSGKGDPFTDAGRAGFREAIDYLGGGTIVGHRDIVATECPGSEIYAWLRDGSPAPGNPASPPAPPTDAKAPGGTNMTIRQVQNALHLIGWPLPVDGVWGDRTKDAVHDFQKGYAFSDLKIDGLATPEFEKAVYHSMSIPGGACGQHFLYKEFASKGNGWIRVARELVRGLIAYRERFGVTVVESGYRDPAHNGAVGGAKESQHLYANAADLPPKAKLSDVVALKVFSGIGYVRSSGLVRHVDVRHVGPKNTTGGTIAKPTTWEYA